MKKIFPVIILITLIFGCVHNVTYDKNFVVKQVEKWDNFILKGVVRFNYKEFTFSANIKIDKTPSLLTMSLYKGGVFGMNNQILFNAKIDSTLHINKNFSKMKFPNINIDAVNGLILSAKKNLNNISRFKVFSSKDYTVSFTNRFELEKVIYKDFTIKFDYLDVLKTLKILKKGKEIVKIEVDRLEFRR